METYDIIDKFQSTENVIRDIRTLRLTLNHWTVIHDMHLIGLDIKLADTSDFLQRYLDSLQNDLKEQCSEED